MISRTTTTVFAAILLGSASTSALAGPSDNASVKLTPLLDARVRFETVDQPSLDADALTFRLRAGAEAKAGHFALLGEFEGTAALDDSYNAFPFALPGNGQWRPQHSVIADPETAELNRLQIQYKNGATALTVGRQRINLDDQRWVGSVGWRQNEQTFDAVRGETKLGPVALDAAYAIGQRTIFGSDAGPRTGVDGHFVFAGAGAKLGPVEAKAFAYLLDFDEAFALANSSQTYGLSATTAISIRGKTKLSLRASYARQSDHAENPFDYAADYMSGEVSTTLAGFTVTGGWERLGSDNGRAVQTPLATLHKFNGWADVFLTTPAAGLEDAYVGITRKFDGGRVLPGLSIAAAFHQFDSDKGDVEYGTEWDASVGVSIRRVALLAKYADYESRGFGADTRKFWLQAEWKL